MKTLGKYSLGMGDRFGCEGEAQLQAVIKARESGVEITPVWNKSYREHTITGTGPDDVRTEADNAVNALSWNDSYYVDADHIGLANVDLFINSSDFFTLDVADVVGQPADRDAIDSFLARYGKYSGSLKIDGIDRPLEISEDRIIAVAGKALAAIGEAGRIYRHIEAAKGVGSFVTEVSMDETDSSQTSLEMLFILAAIADEEIPVQTIAPKFTGRFNKGVDYVGEVARFAKEFEDDIAIIAFAVKEFGLPENLKLSVHSGSDKFSIYESIGKGIRKFDAGLHLKTAGTTWLEELIGLAQDGGNGLDIAKTVYTKALERFDELCGPYASVVDIDRANLPSAEGVHSWTGEQYAAALRHDRSCGDYNPDLRQLLHVSYKIAAEMRDDYLDALKTHRQTVAQTVTDNLYQRHIRAIF